MGIKHRKTICALLVVAIVAILVTGPLRHSPGASAASASNTPRAAARIVTIPAMSQAREQGKTSTTTTTNVPIRWRNFRVGSCVMWNQAVAGSEPRVVPCTQSHIFEVTGRGYMLAGRYPNQNQWSALDDTGGKCYKLGVAYLGGEPYPRSRYAIDSLIPMPNAWSGGEHFAWCGLILGSSQYSSNWGASRGTAKGTGVPTTTTTSTTTTLPEHSLTSSLTFEGGEDLFSANGSSCTSSDTVQIEITDQYNKQLRVVTIDSGTSGVMASGNCTVQFTFGEIPVIQNYDFLWRQPGYSWTLFQPGGHESLADLEAGDWHDEFTLE